MPHRPRLQPAVCALLVTLAACSGDGAPAPEPEPDEAAEDADSGEAAAEPTEDDLRVVRVFDLVADAGTDLDVIGHWEAVVIGEPRELPTGQTVVTIRSTRAFAEAFEPYGFTVYDHDPDRAPFRSSTLAALPKETFFPCGAPAVDSPLFPPYDAHPGAYLDGMEQEMLAMDNGSSIRTESIGTTVQGRDILAVRVGPIEWDVNDETPIVYVMGTHHAREWATTVLVMRMLRAMVDAANGVGDPALTEVLYQSSVVFVPVANPDGYEYSRFTFRDQRKNRRPNGCSVDRWGVDLNRNHSYGHGTPADSISTSNPCADNYVGETMPMSVAEPETVAIENMLAGGVFQGANAALFSYHAYALLGIYPNGLKQSSDADGPECLANSNCVNPDLMSYRRLWGDTETPLSVGVRTGLPYAMDMLNNIIYTTSGDVTAHAAYTGDRMLSVSHEITDRDTGFYIECDGDRDAILDGLTTQNLDVLRRVVEAAPGLVTSNWTTSYVTNQMGAWAPGMIVREASDGIPHEDARPRFLKPVWRDLGVAPPIYSRIDGVDHELQPAREAAEYEAYMLDFSETEEPWCLPCRIDTFPEEQGEDVADGWSCSGCIDLTDPGRLSNWGWQLVDAGDDFWWEPTDPGGEIEIGGGTPPPDASHCNLMFSTMWRDDGSGGVVLERKNFWGGWDRVQDWPMPYPMYELRNRRRLRSHVVEANGLLPGSVPQFRFRVDSSVPDFRLYEPVIYCRLGGLP